MGSFHSVLTRDSVINGELCPLKISFAVPTLYSSYLMQYFKTLRLNFHWNGLEVRQLPYLKLWAAWEQFAHEKLLTQTPVIRSY
jgi:hypothetical protein